MSAGFLYGSAFGIALIIAFALTPLVKRFAFAVGAIDKPNHRKVHTRIMPRLGGLAIYIAFATGALLLLPFAPAGLLNASDINLIRAMLVGGSLIVLIGALDDRFELSAKVKLLGQLAAAGIVVFGFDIQISLVNFPFSDVMQPFADWISIPLTILWIVGVTNAINLIDGLDGLASGVSGIAVGTILVMALLLGFEPIIFMGALLLGGIIGFLYFNFHPAKIFMGDSGSLFLGFSLAMLSLLTFKQVTVVSFIVPLLIIGVPLSDTFFAIVRRLVNRKPIFAPDKGHLHHCLRELGFSHRRTVLIIYGIAAFFGSCAILQAVLIQSRAANWVTLIVVCVLVVGLQIGAELIGIVDKTRRPLLHFIQRLLVKPETQTQSRPK